MATHFVLSLFFVISISFFLSLATAHGILLDPPPRTGSTVITSGPCGGTASQAVVATYKAGDSIDVSWNIMANHQGVINIKLLYQGDIETQGNFDKTILASNIAVAGE